MTDPDGQTHVAALVIAADLSEDQLVTEARARQSSFKTPTVWLVADEPHIVPMSATGKVDKGALQSLLSEQLRRMNA